MPLREPITSSSLSAEAGTPRKLIWVWGEASAGPGIGETVTAPSSGAEAPSACGLQAGAPGVATAAARASTGDGAAAAVPAGAPAKAASAGAASAKLRTDRRDGGNAPSNIGEAADADRGENVRKRSATLNRALIRPSTQARFAPITC